MQWKRLIGALVAAVMVSALGGTPTAGVARAEEPAAQVAVAAQAKYTVLVYGNGSDLESKSQALTNDLKEMMQVGSGALLNVLVETVGTATWHSDIANDRNQRWLIEQGSMKLVDDSLGPRRLDEPANLTDFISWGVKNYPADRYILIFWDHGAGSVDGFGADELHDHTSLKLDGIRKGIGDAVKQSGVHFEVIGFDTCLMATIETATLVSPFANYMVASEELEPGHGWNYTPILQAIAASPAITGDALGKVIADNFKAQAVAQETAGEITLSVTDLSKVPAVVQALESFVTAAGPDVGDPVRIHAVAKARSKSEDYGNGHGSATDMVDLGDLAKNAAAGYPDQAAALARAVTDAVVYKVTSRGKPDGHGLSVYFPLKGKADLDRRVSVYLEHTPFSDVYKSFVLQFGQKLFADQVPVAFESKSPTHGEGQRSRSVTVKKADIADIERAYSVLARHSAQNPDRVLFLGMDSDVQLDPESGELTDSFDGTAVTLNGHFVSLFVTDEAQEFSEYAIPIKLNGKPIDLKVLYDAKKDQAEVVGAWAGIDPLSHMAAREIIKIKPGDQITPLYYYYDAAKGTEGFEEGAAFIADGPLKLGLSGLPNGDYLYGFYIVDLAGNESVSEFETVAVADAQPAAVPPANAQPGKPSDGIKVILNSKRLQFDVAPEVRNGRTLVPVRAIFEALGAEVKWDAATQTVTATKGDMRITLQIDNLVATRRGQSVTLDQAPALSGGRTLVPLRFVSESLGAQVTWDEATQTITITAP